ncbi:MAG: cysteine--tRNA ligase, partial [Lentisphaeria bacterium]|nr:cysteine--tRNA ligase [Lentisphaeria bacterium]
QLFVDGILGLRSELASDNSKLDGIMQLLISLRKDARDNKDFDTSDKIRDGLNELGIELKDGRNGGTDYSL